DSTEQPPANNSSLKNFRLRINCPLILESLTRQLATPAKRAPTCCLCFKEFAAAACVYARLAPAPRQSPSFFSKPSHTSPVLYVAYDRIGCMSGHVCHSLRYLPRMTPVASAGSPAIATVVPPKPLHAAPDSSASAVMHVLPAREQVRMGRAVTVPAGINWLTLAVVIFFQIGALAAFFFFTWQRLAVMAVLYVLAINVGIGMCYHRLLTHRGYRVPKWLEYVD